MRTTLALIVCTAALVLRAAAQEPVSSQEPAPTKQSSTASLEGKVMKDLGGEPLKKAIIELIGENQEEGGNYTGTSDPEGNFKITGIRAGRYHLFVERPGFLEVDEKHRHCTGITLSLNAGQELKDQLLRMLPAAIITGRVVDEDGDPMPDVMITVLRKRPGSRVKFQPTGSAQTNDLGEFRIGGLFPGKYYVSAAPLPNFQNLVQTQKKPTDPPDPSADLSYVQTFYPNVVNRAAASAIELHAGDDMPVDFSLARVHTAHVRGSVDGLPADAKAVVLLRGNDGNSMFNAAEVEKNGKFEIPHVAPGAYTLVVMTMVTNPPRIARSSIVVADSNIDDLKLTPAPGATVRGQVRLPKSLHSDSSTIMLQLLRLDDEDDMFETAEFETDDMTMMRGGAKLKADGSFELKNVPPGLYEVQVSGDSKVLTDSFVESVMAGTKEVVDTGLNVIGGTLSVTVVVSTEAPVLEGIVSNDKGQTISNAEVLAVPVPKFRKQPARYPRATTDQSGHFTLRGLHPGEYKLLAWEALDGDEYLDAEFLTAFENQANVVKIDKGAHQSVSLKVIPAASDQP